MPVTLSECVRRLRAELGHSLVPAHGVQLEETLKYALERSQRELWVAWDWPQVAVYRTINIAQGSRLYNVPAGLTFESVRKLWRQEGSDWVPLDHGFSLDDEDLNQGSPIQWRWNADTSQIEINPTPLQAGVIKILGCKELAPFIADTDAATLDADCIVFAAAVDLCEEKDLQKKNNRLQRHLNNVFGNSFGSKRGWRIMGGGLYNTRRPARAWRDYIPS